MIRTVCVLSFVLVLAAGVSAREIVLVDEDFEAGAGDWAAVRVADNGQPAYPPPAYDDLPVVFPADGTGIYGPNTGFPGTPCVGFSADLTQLDYTYVVWLQRQLPAAVPAGTYDVDFDFYRYVYKQGVTDTYKVCNRLYLLTNSLYDDPAWWNFDGSDPYVSPYWSTRTSMWNQETGSGSNEGGMWQRKTFSKTGMVTDGNLEVRLSYWEQGPVTGKVTVAFDNLTITLKQGGVAVYTFTDALDYATQADLLSVWTAKVHPNHDPNRPNNDTTMLFSSTDPLLYDNNNNPGSQSAGFTSAAFALPDPTRGQWLQKQLTGVVPANTTARMRLEYDWYVFMPWLCLINNDTPAAFDAAGTGIKGPNTGHNGTPSAGYSSDRTCYDGSSATWIQMQLPGWIAAGSYKVELGAKLYIYKDTSVNDSLRSRIYVLTQDLYNNPAWDYGGTDPNASGKGGRRTTPNQTSPGVWQTITQAWTANVVVTNDDGNGNGNVEFRLLQQESSTPGAQTVAWDDVVFTFKDPTTGEVLKTFTESFDAGLGAWTAMVYPNDPPDPADAYGVANRVFLLTDDEFNMPQLNYDTNTAGFYDPGYRVDLWPSSPDYTFAANGTWQHFVDERDILTTTGDFELRLLCHDRSGQKVQTVAWDNVKLTLIVPCNAPRFDADDDGDVDHVDFSLMQLCYSGDSVAWTGECRCFNADGDTDIDTVDMQGFEACASGPGVEANENCDSTLSPP